RKDLARLIASSDATVSPTLHDGTPNSLLEAMACGCVPVAGDLDSVREWITHAQNGLLCDVTSPASIASAVIRVLNDANFRERARVINRKLIEARAERDRVMVR